MGDPQDGFLFTRASEAPARTLLTPRVHLRPPTEEAVGRRSPQGPCFSPQSLLPPPAFWTRIPGRDPGSSRGGGRNRLLLLGRSGASLSSSVRTLPRRDPAGCGRRARGRSQGLSAPCCPGGPGCGGSCRWGEEGQRGWVLGGAGLGWHRDPGVGRGGVRRLPLPRPSQGPA